MMYIGDDARRYALAAAFCALTAACATSARADPPAAQPRPDDFAYQIPLAPGAPIDGGFARVALTPLVYRGALHADLGDLRVFNAAGVALPYSITTPTSKTQRFVPLTWFPLPASATTEDMQRIVMQVSTWQSSIYMSGASSQAVAPQGYLVDLSATFRDGNPAPLDSLVLDWKPAGGSFNDDVRVDCSDDLQRWSWCTSSVLVQMDYAGHELKQDAIRLNGRSAHYLRLNWPPGRLPQTLTSLQAVLDDGTAPTVRETADITADPAPGQPGDYVYDAGVPIGADGVQLMLPLPGSLVQAAILVRDAADKPWRAVASGVFYRLIQDGHEIKNPPLAFNSLVHARYWLVRADPRSSDLGKLAPGLELGWQAQDVVFLAQAPGPYTLAFGSPSVQGAGLPLAALLPGYGAAPDATLAHVTRTTLPNNDDLQAIMRNPAVLRTPWVGWQRWLAWAALVGGVLLLGWMAWRLVRQMEHAP